MRGRNDSETISIKNLPPLAGEVAVKSTKGEVIIETTFIPSRLFCDDCAGVIEPSLPTPLALFSQFCEENQQSCFPNYNKYAPIYGESIGGSDKDGNE